jgi:acyl-CoA dehydrogenase
MAHAGGAAGSSGASVGVPDRVAPLRAALAAFVRDHVLPAEAACTAAVDGAAPGQRFAAVPAALTALKARAKALGLWNLFLPAGHPEVRPWARVWPPLSNAEYAPLAEAMGWSPLASVATNCAAPDTGNMEVLIKYGTASQQAQWLAPLLEGSIRSAFLMTEPAVASSDPTNLATTFARAPGGGYIVTGRKWWATGAMHPECEVFLVLGRVEGSDAAPPHARHTLLLVPRRAPGVTVVRPLTVFGYDDAPEGHAEVTLERVFVPASAVILGEGRGFEIAQGRLGPGRVHHCMRAVGLGERCLAEMVARVGDPARAAFGRPLWQHATIQADIAESRMDIESARQLVLHAARVIDAVGPRGARREVALIKVAVPRAILRVIDRAIQAHGGAGVSEDTPLARAWAGMRTLRIADGPDIVHLRTVALLELRDALRAQAGAGAGGGGASGGGEATAGGGARGRGATAAARL